MSRIAHFGTWDVDNYGDLLFPLLIEQALPHHDFVHVSPTGQPTSFTDAKPSIAFSELSDDDDVDAVVVGGGNIVEVGTSPLPDYRRMRRTAYPSLWIGAAAFAARRSIPLLICGPGVRDVTRTGGLARKVFADAAYASVRDAESAERVLAQDAGATIRIRPDAALALSQLWPAAELRVPSHHQVAGPTVAIHVNDRYTTAAEAAAGVDRIARALEATPVLIAIGRCHDDHLFAEEVATEMAVDPVVIGDPQTLEEVAATIARADAYVGSSMHGYITACAYGRPALLVTGQQPLHKFVGLLRHLGAEDRLVDSWDEAAASPFFGQGPAAIDAARVEISEDWDRVDRAVTGGAAASSSLALHWWRPVIEARNLEADLRKEMVDRARRVRDAVRARRSPNRDETSRR